MQGTCPICGSTFEANVVGRPRIYCSRRCSGKAVQRGRVRPSRCGECGGQIQQKKFGPPRIYCSKECNARVRNRRSRRRVQPIDLGERACRVCGVMFKPRRADGVYCSRTCYGRGNANRPRFTPEERACIECGASYTARRHDAKFCQPQCAFAFHGRARMNRARTGRQSPYIDREVFERDGWVCWLCGESVDPTLSRKHKRGATIDHVVPLARGGADSPENVRLAHRDCNNAKHTRIVA